MQNSMADLFGVMNILDPATYNSQEDFFRLYGWKVPTAEQVLALQVGAPACPPSMLIWLLAFGARLAGNALRDERRQYCLACPTSNTS